MTTTKLAWCTPFSTASAIGHFSALVVSSLREHLGWEVDIFHPNGSGGRTRPDSGTELGDDAASVLGEYDTVVYNLGDNPANHGTFVKLLPQVPGLVVLHDVSLLHLMLPDLAAGPEQAVRRELERWYGAAGGEALTELRKNAAEWVKVPANVDAFPLVELVLENATGVVTHSEYAAGLLRERFAGDIWTLGLPREADDLEAEPVELEMIDDREVILQAGVPNRNKHIPAVIEAFDRAGISDKAQLVICGYGNGKDFADLQDEVSDRGLTDSVKLLGRVSDQTLDALRRKALIATVLRYPFGEAASAVLLDSMAYGLAVLTVNGGQYAEVPADTVVRIDTPPRAADMVPTLQRWIAEPEQARALGLRARAYVGEHHSGERYARDIAGVIEQAGSFARRRLLADQLATTLKSLGFSEDDEIVGVVGDAAAELFAAAPARPAEIFGRPKTERRSQIRV